MQFDRTKLKQVEVSDLFIDMNVYEIKQGVIIYRVDKSFDKQFDKESIPLVVVSDTNGYFKRNQVTHRPISNLLMQ